MGEKFGSLWKTEDWWAVWFGLGLVLLSLIFFWNGGSIGNWATIPSKWSQFHQVGTDFAKNWPSYLVILLGFGLVFSFSVRLMGQNLRQFIPGFGILCIASLAIFYVAGWKIMQDLNIEAPLLALLVGLGISNVFKIPAWFKSSLRTEYYIKTGIVLLGATLPLTLIFSAGPIAFIQATLVSVITWLTIFLAATRIFKLEPHFGAVLGAGGAVCGVSASIAVGGAIKAKKDHISIGIAVVTVWAIVMILVLTVVLKHLVPDTIHPGVAGAWVGTSEFADAAGLAVVAELANRFGDAPINAFTLMKVIGRDIWIGIWCLILSIVSVVWWERGTGPRQTHLGPVIIWERFPKFVIGFLAASIVMSLVSTRVPTNYMAQAAWQGKAKGVEYNADFADYRIPAEFADRFLIDPAGKSISYRGEISRGDLAALTTAATSQDQVHALGQLQANSSWASSVLTPKVISPIKKLRSWAFVLCFLSIGLSTRFADLFTFGIKPFWAFTIGVLVNIPLGFFLSTVVFVDFWSKL
jgi:uncharacterized membrane protein YadS